MTAKSKIEWTEQTWNPIVGCSIISPGCTNCYAMKMAARIEAMGNQPRYAGTTRKVNGNAIWTGKLVQAPESALLAPLRRKVPTVYFVNSMGDLFHEACPDEWIDRVFAVMALCPQHTFQVLTKRAARMRDYISSENRCHIIGDEMLRLADIRSGFKCVPWPFPNVWLGISAERQQEGDHPTQKPIGVMKWCIGHIPPPALKIIDPFMGSGTTGVAAVQMHRKFTGIERVPRYFDVACKRVSEALRQPDMLLVEKPTLIKQEAML